MFGNFVILEFFYLVVPMICFPPWLNMLLRIPFLTLFLACCKINAASQQGRVGLWSDSECNSKSGLTSSFGQPDPITLNFTLSPDVCGVPGATVHSYRVLQDAICANGTTAAWNYYNRNNCTADPTDEDPDPGLTNRTKNRRQSASVLDGECLALVAFNSFAFVCEGVALGEVKINSLPASAFSSTISSAFSTLMSTSFSDFSNTATVSSAPNSSATPSSATVSPPRSLPTISKSGSKSRLSAGASAGIGIGGAVGVLATASLCFFFFRRYKVVRIDDQRRSQSASGDPAMTSLSNRGNIARMVGAPSIYETGIGQSHEIEGVATDTIHEAGADNEIHEIANPQTPTRMSRA